MANPRIDPTRFGGLRMPLRAGQAQRRTVLTLDAERVSDKHDFEILETQRQSEIRR
jgi:hypothetical protein